MSPDVAVRVQLDLSGEERRVRRVADGDEHAVERQLTQVTGLEIADDDADDLALAAVLDLGDLRNPR